MVKPYEDLTRLGRIRRLRRVVFKALEEYDLEIDGVKFLTIDTNTMFQIRSVEGERFVLRIYSDEETTLKENQAEMFWLDAIIRDTDIKVCQPVPRRDGEYITILTVPGIPPDRRCVLFKWIPGRPLEEHLSPETYYQFGQVLAKLHLHAATLNPLPAFIQPKKWDRVFYYPDEPVVYNTPEYSRFFPPERIRLLERVIERSDRVFERLFSDQSGLMLIHGDLHFWNLHYHKGELYALDFEDINRGYPVQDIAVSLAYGREREGYDEWKAAFKEGYCSIRAWPKEDERTIETLVAARTVMFINYVARIDPTPQEYIESRCERLEEYLRTFS